MIVVTGAYGFLGSCLVTALNEAGFHEIIVVDDFYKDRKEPNLEGKVIRDWIHRDLLIPWLEKADRSVDFVFHMGAHTDVSSTDDSDFEWLNVGFSRRLWQVCADRQIPMVYASTAATYGKEVSKYSDDHDDLALCKPESAYARSKHTFDEWALAARTAPPHWAGLKFFNIFGPNEYHKKGRASIVFRLFREVQETGEVCLGKSNNRSDLLSRRIDLLYVKDAVKMCIYFMRRDVESGLYNIASGKSETFENIAESVFNAMSIKPSIKTAGCQPPEDRAMLYLGDVSVDKIESSGYEFDLRKVSGNIAECVQEYLLENKYY